MALNPYIIGRPIRANDSQLFFGREPLFKFIEDNLLLGIGGAGGKVILLHGQRRIGKTSLLMQIPRRINLEEFVFVQFDLQGEAEKSLGNILSDLAQAIVVSCSLQGQVTPTHQDSLEQDRSVFERDFLPQVFQALDDKNLVLLLDEFDVLDDGRKKGTTNDFFTYLASIIRTQEKLFIIPVVGRQLDDIPRLIGLFTGAPHQEIGLLDRESAEQQIKVPAREILQYTDEAITAILELSSGHPYFTQLLCYAVFSRAREKNFPPVERTDVEAIVDKAIEIGEGGLTWFWSGLPPLERLVFSAIAEAQENDLPGEAWTILKDYGVAQRERLREAEKRLLAGGFLQLESTGFYRVTVELVRRWLVRRYPLRQELISFLDIEEPTLAALVQRAKGLSQKEEGELLPLFGGKQFEILQMLLKPLKDFDTDTLQLTSPQLAAIATKILELYAETTGQEIPPEEGIACISQIAYLESLKAIATLSKDTKQETLFKEIEQAPVYQLLELQIDQLEKDDWRLNEAKATTILFSFHNSKLAEVLAKALTSTPTPLLQGEESEISTWIERIKRGTHQYIVRILRHEGDVTRDFRKQSIIWNEQEIKQQLRNYYQSEELVNFLKDKAIKYKSDIADYLQEQDKKYETLNSYLQEKAFKLANKDQVFHENFAFKDIYIPLKPQPVNGGQGIYGNLHDWAKTEISDLDKRDQILVVEGEPGRGKSTFCRMFADYVRQNLHPIWTPIWIELRDIKELEDKFETTIQKALLDLLDWDFVKDNDNWLNDANTRFFFLLDGLDELITERNTEQGLETLLQQVVDFQRKCGLYPEVSGHRILLTSSPTAIKQILTIPSIERKVSYYLERVEIQKMDKDLRNSVIDKYIYKWKELNGKDIEESQLKSFCDKQESLSAEPLLLYLLAAMYKDNALLDDRLSRHHGVKCSSMLHYRRGLALPNPYQVCIIRFTYHHRYGRAEKQDKISIISIYEKTLAWVIQKQLPEQIIRDLLPVDRDKLTKNQIEYLKQILSEAGLCAVQSGGIRATRSMLEERLENKNSRFAKQTPVSFNTAIASFSNEPSNKERDKIQFNHKSFSEFLYARRLRESIDDWTKTRRSSDELLIPSDRFYWEIYDLLGFGGLTPDIVGYLRELIEEKIEEKKFSMDRLQKLFERLENFYLRWFKGDFINNEFSQTLAQRKALQLQKPLEALGLFLGRRQIDIYTILNVFILLLELDRYRQQKCQKDYIAFYPCGKSPSSESAVQKLSLPTNPSTSPSDDFDPYRLLRLIGHSAWLSAEVFIKTAGPFLGRINLRLANLQGVQLYGVNLKEAYLSNAILDGINLSRANLESAFLGNAKLRRASLSHAKLRDAFLGNADLRGIFLDNANLQNAVLTGTNLRSGNLSNANLEGAYFGDAELSDANLKSANLKNADFSSANLSDANLKGADLSGAIFTGTKLTNANLQDIKFDEETKFDSAALEEAFNVPDELKKL